MTVYKHHDTCYTCEGLTIPDDANNFFYIKMMQEVTDGISTIEEITVSFDDIKARKKQEINKKTDTLIAQGITHNSVEFKINVEKEISAMALNAARSAGADMAGKKFRAKDQTYTFVDTADFDAWFNAAFARVESLLVSGSELKDQVDAAADQAALDAIVDNRV
jgi:hypothetical protein